MSKYIVSLGIPLGGPTKVFLFVVLIFDNSFTRRMYI